MKVVLIKDVSGLGRVGEVKEVSDGYARNFLLPGALVKIATAGAVRKAEELKEKYAEQVKRAEQTAKERAEKLSERSVVIKAKADETDNLYAAVHEDEILAALGEDGAGLKKENVKFADPIKTLGEHEVALELGHEQRVKIKVKVEKE